MSEERDPWDPDWEGPSKRPGKPAGKPALARRSPRARMPAGGHWRPGPLVALVSTLPGALLIVALLGIGLRHDAPPWEACVAAALLTVLPVLGLGSLFRHRGIVLVAAMWLWPLLSLLALPTWFPGERVAGLSEGFAWMALPLGETWTGRAGRMGEGLGGLFGDEEPLVVATPIEIEPRPETGATVAGSEPTPTPDPDDGTIVLPYEGDGGSMRVRVTFDGLGFSEELQLLFDTGATFTTLDRGTLEGFGVTIPADAPTAQFQTANGQVESPMVLLDRVWLSDRAIDGVTVAVCDDCSQGPTAGLLGLNVTRQFHVRLDHELQEITLEPGEGGSDRHLDITHWLNIEGQVTRWPTGRVVVELTGRSRAPRPIREAVVEVECPDSSFAVQLNDIPSQGTRTTRLELPRGTSCDSYRVILRTADWGAAPTR